ncbi:hypothetical protein BKA63DRAFT_571119 [Paraphoma chrysanthemicola]|nr:hypothetical protein BKA63DRAFT_571119 [Paraphoma chrysanthemicola]
MDARPDSSSHHMIDLAIIKARQRLGTKAKIFIMLPPLIYGATQHGRLSIHIITIARFAIKHKYAGYWSKIATFIGKDLHAAGMIPDSTPREIPQNEYDDLFGEDSLVVIGQNSRNRADRLRDLGWRPKEVGVHEAFTKEELPILLRETGEFKGMPELRLRGVVR